MRSRVTRALSAAVVTTTLVLSSCKRTADDPRIVFQTSATVNITANCTADNQVDVVVDQWVLRMKKKGAVAFNALTASGAVIEVTQKTAAQWPFDEDPPFKGNAKGKIKDRDGDYRYNVQVTCPSGTGGNPVRVVIDPDIIVN